MDSRTPDTCSLPVDDFVTQLAERLELPRDTTEARLGELLIAYREVARARTGKPSRVASNLDVEPETVSFAPN